FRDGERILMYALVGLNQSFWIRQKTEFRISSRIRHPLSGRSHTKFSQEEGMRSYLSISLVLVCLCLGAIPAMAQNASLVGTVRDAQQAGMPGGTVTLKNVDTGIELTLL